MTTPTSFNDALPTTEEFKADARRLYDQIVTLDRERAILTIAQDLLRICSRGCAIGITVLTTDALAALAQNAAAAAKAAQDPIIDPRD